MDKNNKLFRVTAIIMGLIGLFFLVGGFWLVTLNGSWYYLILSWFLLLTALFLWNQDGFAYLIFACILVASGLWSLWEVGLRWWLLVPRLWVWFVIGLILLLPYWRKAISKPITAYFLMFSLLFVAIIGFTSLFFSPDSKQGKIANTVKLDIDLDDVAGADWTAYGGSNAGLHYSSLTQITPDNINQLQEVWRVRTGDMPTSGDPVELTNENTPLKVNNRLYTCTAHGWVLALKPETGETLWKFEPQISLEGAADFRGWAHMTCRGVSYYDADHYLARDAKASAAQRVKASECPRRLYLPTADARLIALNADTGQLCEDFGEHGAVDLKRGLGEFAPGGYYSTSPALITQNLVIVGGHVTDDASTNEPSGVVRAFDIQNGRLIWNWDSGNPEQTTPLPEGKTYTRNSPNVWSIMSADEDLGLIYLPLGNQTPDQYGADRTLASEKYSAGIVALAIDSGKVRWHYQLTHHDLWDMDVPSQPILVDLNTASGMQPAVIQPTKQGSLYVLNRETGQPIIAIDEVAAPQDVIKGDWVSKTQPRSQLNLLPQPLTEQSMWGATPFDQLVCRINFKSLRYEGQYTAPSLQGSLIYPGNVGVMNWGGVAVDPQKQLIFASPNYMAFVSKLVPQEEAAKMSTHASEGQGLQPNKGASYAVELHPFLSFVGFPCQAPSWGDIAGIDLRDANVVWQHPNGTSYDSTPIVHLPFPVGVPAMGGPMITAGGVAFLSGTLDQYIRGYDVTTGQEIWKTRLPAGGQATPMTFAGDDGRQYVVLVVGGHGSFGTKMGDYIIGYALPDQ
ncbi:glucose/quinate/shikimate family membrane-bound PQQ-dependent dehydrogenase [Utexia brackfieldae]|uniref:glucose/quinate/shikimate family membrane-bound PQQ-dependent dehydrogenase n=1 Tax=Utexia brackfieldae TaxID=3074108 RepID=UPI00370DCFB5